MNSPVIRRALTACGRGLTLFACTIAEVLAFGWAVVTLALLSGGLGVFLLPEAIGKVRALAGLARRRAGEWGGVEIAEPYLPAPEFQRGFIGRIERCRWLLTDPATRRDLLWCLTDPVAGGLLALLPVTLIVYGLEGVLMPAVWQLFHAKGYSDWYTAVPVSSEAGPVTPWLCVPIGLAFIAAGVRWAPRLLEVHARWTRVLLAPTPKAGLALRVRHLTETRADAVDTQAAELRRIERDLHDGAQARLVAMGMSLGAIEHLLERDPEKARLLLAEARQASAKALNELRDLVRGIHPPVLADRGLGDAVKALALDNPLEVEVTTDLGGRLEPPVESAAYFAVAEMLANATKHSGARRVWIDLRHEAGVLRMTVTDDGQGGASLSGGTGLRGIERRIGTFDGILALSSPAGGPTTVTMELPCALSSPRTSSS
ncbi:sensor histidine kinase [Actinomadura scrupuli]|uniref:sensor histidine kinase n=1 Tax=Actinomadura scrupuli TaxID=559629 RepID=UPI003D95FE7C